MSLWSEVGDNLDYYLIYGGTMDSVIAVSLSDREGAFVRKMGLRLLARRSIIKTAMNIKRCE
jgi:hypothetical protein